MTKDFNRRNHKNGALEHYAEIIKNHVCEAPTFCFAVVCGKKAAYEDGGKWYCKLHYEHVLRCRGKVRGGPESK